VEKGLKPMCRDYGIPATGAKAALVARLLEHEATTPGAQGRAVAAATRQAVPGASSELVQAVRALVGDRESSPVSPSEVATYLRLFAESVESFYPAQTPVAAGSLFEGVAAERRRCSCVVDGRTGTLRVLATVLDDRGAVAAQRDDTAAFAGSLARAGGQQTRSGRELCDAFADAREAQRRVQRAADMGDSPGTVHTCAVLRAQPDGRGWAVTLLPDRVPALLPEDQELLPGAEELRPGVEVSVVILPRTPRDLDALAQGAPLPIRVSRRDASLVTGLLTRHAPALRDGTVTVVHAQRSPGRITKVVVKHALGHAAGHALPARIKVLGPDMAYVNAAREELGGRETIQLIDLDLLGSSNPAAFVGACLWPGAIAHVELGSGADGGAVAYAVEEKDLGLSVGRGGCNIATAAALCRKVLGKELVPSISVKALREAEADGVTVKPAYERPRSQQRPAGEPPRRASAAGPRGFASRAGPPTFQERLVRPASVPSRQDDDDLFAALNLPPLPPPTPAPTPRAPQTHPRFDNSEVSSFWGDLAAGAELQEGPGDALRLSDADEHLFEDVVAPAARTPPARSWGTFGDFPGQDVLEGDEDSGPL